jgi:endonuclease/exonuclease/phosphatase family metal-dependent hydrolase
MNTPSAEAWPLSTGSFRQVNAPFTIASWNLFQGLHHSSRRDAWVQNLPIKDHLESLDADVLVLPEAWRFNHASATWAEDTASRMGYELHQWVSGTPSRSREMVPWRIVMMTRIPARPLPPQVMPRLGGFGQRAIVRAELIEYGLTVAAAHQYGIHLLLRPAPRAWLKERAELRLAASANDIIAGDLNMWGPVVHHDARPLRATVRGRTYPAKRPHSQIDHVLVSDRVELLASEVLPEMGSDHRAIRTTLQNRS